MLLDRQCADGGWNYGNPAVTQENKLDGAASPYLRWDLQNEAGLRVASGMYIAIVTSPKYGEKILKFGVIQPQKQLPRF